MDFTVITNVNRYVEQTVCLTIIASVTLDTNRHVERNEVKLKHLDSSTMLRMTWKKGFFDYAQNDGKKNNGKEMIDDKKGYVYIMTNVSNTTFYIGVTNDINRRVYEHKNHLIKGFTDKYNLVKLIYVEEYALIKDAIVREKQLKGWRRQKKIDLILSLNPEMKDISDGI